MSDAMWGFLGSILVAVITVIGVVYQSRKNNDSLVSQLAKQSEVSDAKMQGEIDNVRTEMENLKHEVEKHNNLVERTYKLERDVAVLDNKQKVADKRILDLEQKTA